MKSDTYIVHQMFCITPPQMPCIQTLGAVFSLLLQFVIGCSIAMPCLYNYKTYPDREVLTRSVVSM